MKIKEITTKIRNITCLLMFFICTANTALAQVKEELIDGVLNNEFQVYTTKKNIDRAFLKYVKKTQGKKFSIVNDGETYNSTDFIFYKNKPSRSLIFYAQSIDKNWGIILYNHGRVGRINICLLYQRIGREIHYELFLLKGKDSDLEYVRTSLRNGDYRTMENSLL